MATDDTEFLRDQVQRLNSVLAQYQEKYPPIGIRGESALSSEGPSAPWLTDQNLVSPLLKEYDTRTQVLEEQLDSYRRDHRELRGQIDKLVAENKRLTRELKLAIESQLERIDGSMAADVDVEEDQVLNNLTTQLQMALQEKESAMEMWQASVQEVERLEQDLQSQSVNPRVKHLQETTERIKEQYTKTVHELNNEIGLLQEELRRCKSELKASSIQVTDLRKTLESMKGQLVRTEHEKMSAEGEGTVAGGRLREVQKSIDDLQTKLEDSNKELGHLRKEKHTMEVRILELQKKVTSAEANEYDRSIQIKESNQIVETAMLEKDQALVRERQAQEQVEKMQEALARLVDEAGARTRIEVDNVKKQCNQNISRLMEEIHTLELENSAKQAIIDRAIREKRAAESELEKLYREGLVQTSKEGSTREELNRRACDAERMRDEALMKLDSAQNELRRADISHKQEKSKLNTEIKQLRDRVEALNREFEEANNDRIKLTEEIDKLKRNVQKLKSERDSSQRNYTKEMTILERDIRMKEQNFEVKLQSVEDAHRHAMMELRQMLAAQQRMSAKWKEECNTITQKFETKVGDLRAEVSRHKRRIEELTKLLRESKEKNIEAENMITEYGRNIKRMEDRVRDAENRAANASLQVAKQLGKARQLLHTSAHTTYDSNMRQSFHDSNRSKTSGVADPLNMSDLAPNGSVHKSSVRIMEQETVDTR